jgi:hypothetical protein
MTGSGAGPGRPGSGGTDRSAPPFSARRVVVLWVAIGMVTALVLMVIATLAGVGTPATSPGAGSPGAGSPGAGSPGAAIAELRVVGLIMTIDASSPVDVRSFTLRTDAGQVLTFDIVPGVDTGFPAGHLQEHRASAALVQVTYHVSGGRNLVDHLDDAPTASPSA